MGIASNCVKKGLSGNRGFQTLTLYLRELSKIKRHSLHVKDNLVTTHFNGNSFLLKSKVGYYLKQSNLNAFYVNFTLLKPFLLVHL